MSEENNADDGAGDLPERIWTRNYMQINGYGMHVTELGGDARFCVEYVRADKAEADAISLLRVIADIRVASGVGDRPMLSELAGEIGALVKPVTLEAALEVPEIKALVAEAERVLGWLERRKFGGSNDPLRAARAALKGGRA